MKTLKLIKNDPWLAPYKQAIEGRHNRAVEKISELTGGTGNLSDFADGYLYFGLHKENGHWVFREWAPNANAIYLIGNFSNWKERPEYPYTGPEDKENAFRLGPRESCKTPKHISSRHKFGIPKSLSFFQKSRFAPKPPRC